MSVSATRKCALASANGVLFVFLPSGDGDIGDEAALPGQYAAGQGFAVPRRAQVIQRKVDNFRQHRVLHLRDEVENGRLLHEGADYAAVQCGQ
jgi:hypothetical protein